MPSNIDFYDLPEDQQRQFLQDQRVIADGVILKSIPDGEPPVRVLEQSFSDTILDLLGQGYFTAEELAEEIGVRKHDVRTRISGLKQIGRKKAYGTPPTEQVLQKRNGVIRVKNMRGPAAVYTLESVPFHARVTDPTLGFSLLNFEERLAEFPVVIDHIPAGKASEMDEDYARVVGDFWEIPAQEAFDYLTQFDRSYIDTAMGPLPNVHAPDEEQPVRDRLSEADDSYERRSVTDQMLERILDGLSESHVIDSYGLRLYQRLSIELFDCHQIAKYNDSGQLSAVEDAQKQVVEALNPENFDDSDESLTADMEFENVVLETVSAMPMTVEEIHNNLPEIYQVSYPVTDLEQLLQNLCNAGIVDERIESDQPQYYK